MSDYDFVIDNIRFSYSSTTTFDNCPYAFKLSYIDLKPRVNNFFAEYGSFIHDCLEKYFKGELDSFELSGYYSDNYPEMVKERCPMGIGAGEKYKAQGQAFFDNFYFPKDDYDVLLTESKLDFSIGKTLLVAKPDLVLQNKKTGSVTLYDYKTALPFKADPKTGELVPEKKKINDYCRQMFIYTYALRVCNNIQVDMITLWFPRNDRMIHIEWKDETETAAISWITDVIEGIKSEKYFYYNNKNPFFCNNLCSVREFCEYRPELG